MYSVFDYKYCPPAWFSLPELLIVHNIVITSTGGNGTAQIYIYRVTNNLLYTIGILETVRDTKQVGKICDTESILIIATAVIMEKFISGFSIIQCDLGRPSFGTCNWILLNLKFCTQP